MAVAADRILVDDDRDQDQNRNAAVPLPNVVLEERNLSEQKEEENPRVDLRRPVLLLLAVVALCRLHHGATKGLEKPKRKAHHQQVRLPVHHQKHQERSG